MRMSNIVFNDNVITPMYCVNEDVSSEVGQDKYVVGARSTETKSLKTSHINKANY